MFDNQLRVLKDRLLRWPTQWLARYCPPLLFTIANLLLGCGTAVALFFGHRLIGFGLWIGSRICDGLDGSIARFNKRQSNLGGYLDLLLDVTLYTLIPLAAAAAHSDTRIYWWVALLLGSYYINVVSWLALSVLLEKQQQRVRDAKHSNIQLTSIQMPVGVMEGTETLILYALICLLPHYLALLFIIGATLTFLGAIQRLWWAIRYRSVINRS